ncbi:MAG: hypothetical protein IJM19_09660 [Ruminococcus sp.]|nr:hypothetical protein [Ruminococcus sp.]
MKNYKKIIAAVTAVAVSAVTTGVITYANNDESEENTTENIQETAENTEDSERQSNGEMPKKTKQSMFSAITILPLRMLS